MFDVSGSFQPDEVLIADFITTHANWDEARQRSINIFQHSDVRGVLQLAVR